MDNRGRPSWPRVKRRAEGTPPAPDPAARSKKSATQASGSPACLRRDASSRERATPARSMPAASMERTRTAINEPSSITGEVCCAARIKLSTSQQFARYSNNDEKKSIN
ncbi:hypothetical protein BHE74_00056328 [Ensete ventricosum]|nr:hypothetical protein BHE74_00056328 [Ensete ventricosum]